MAGPPYFNIEYAGLTSTATLQNYVIGTNAYTAEPGRVPRFFVAKRILVFCTQDVNLRWNNSRASVVFIPANTYLGFDVLLSVLYYQRVAANGTLRIWTQG